MDIDELLEGGREPTQNEQWVAAAMANEALERLCIGLVVELRDVGEPDPDTGEVQPPETIIDRLLGGVSNNVDLKNWTDLQPGIDFDMDIAKRVALEMLEDHILRIRRTGLNER